MNKFEFIGEVFRGVSERHGDNIVWRSVITFDGRTEDTFDVLCDGVRKQVHLVCRDNEEESRSILTVYVDGVGKKYDFDSVDYHDSVEMIVKMIDDMIKKEV